MKITLTKSDKQALIAATEANYIAYFEGFACLPQCSFSRTTEFTWFLVDGLPGSTVLHTHLESSRVDERIREQLQLLTSTKAGYSGWWQVLPTCQPATLAQSLQAHGLAPTAGRPVMTLDLQPLSGELTLQDNLRIEHVRNQAQLMDWLTASAAGFEAKLEQVQIYYDAYAYLLDQTSIFQHYVGYLDEQPVTSSTLLLAGGLAGIYDVSTAPEARRHGLGRAITLAPLLEARQRGYRYSVLQSSNEGHSLYLKMGFTELYKEENYIWKRGKSA